MLCAELHPFSIKSHLRCQEIVTSYYLISQLYIYIYINVTLMYTSGNLLASAKATFWEHIGDRAERAITSQQNNNSLTIYVSL